MNLAKLGRIARGASRTMACVAVFAAVLVAAPSARAHGGVSIGIGFGFPAFIGAPVYAPPVYYVPPPVYYSAPYCWLLWTATAIQASLSPGTSLSSLLLLLLIPPCTPWPARLTSPHPFRQRGNRHDEMIQCREGLRLHRSGWWRKGRIRPHLGSRTIRAHGPQ
jgi:hypothetical protein